MNLIFELAVMDFREFIISDRKAAMPSSSIVHQ